MNGSSSRSALLVGVLLSLFVLSGCTSGGDDPEERPEHPEGEEDPGEFVEGIGPDYVVLMNPIDGSGCRRVEVVVEIPESHASSLLPDGFEPAPGPTGMNAAVSLETHACERSETEEGEAGYKRVWAGVHVRPPELPEPAEEHERENRTSREDAQESRDLYVVAAYTDGQGFQRFLRQSGIPYELAWIDLMLERSSNVVLAQVEVEGRESGDDGLRLAAPVADMGETTMHRTAWATTTRGVQAFEELLHQEEGGAFTVYEGSGVCVVREGLFVESLGQQGCATSLVRVSTGFRVEGHSLWFHDTRVLE